MSFRKAKNGFRAITGVTYFTLWGRNSSSLQNEYWIGFLIAICWVSTGDDSDCKTMLVHNFSIYTAAECVSSIALRHYEVVWLWSVLNLQGWRRFKTCIAWKHCKLVSGGWPALLLALWLLPLPPLPSHMVCIFRGWSSTLHSLIIISKPTPKDAANLIFIGDHQSHQHEWGYEDKDDPGQ